MTTTAWLLAAVGGLALVAAAVAVVAWARLRRSSAAPAGAPAEVLEGLARLAGLVEGRMGAVGEGQ